MGLSGTCDIPLRANDLEIRLASETELDALVRLAVAFRDHLGLATPVEGGRPRSGDGALLRPAQFPGAPAPGPGVAKAEILAK